MNFKELEKLLKDDGWLLKGDLMKIIYPAIFCPYEDSDIKGYTVEFPDLLGCITEGDTLEIALEMALDAAGGWIYTQLEDNLEIPIPSKIHTVIPSKSEGFVNLIMIDINKLSDKFGAKSVRKNLTIPYWLNKKAEKANINFSNVLQEALFEKLKIAK